MEGRAAPVGDSVDSRAKGSSYDTARFTALGLECTTDQ